MKKSELQGFRRTLRAHQADIGTGARTREALAIETSPDELDRIQQAQLRDFAVGALNRESLRLRQVTAALDRIDRGRFGICLSCDQEIGSRRLVALPWADSCIVCQEVVDRSSMDLHRAKESLLSAA